MTRFDTGDLSEFFFTVEDTVSFQVLLVCDFKAASHSETLIQGALEIKFWRVKVEAN